MPSLQPYGGPGWALSCLLPPSAISLFASVLVKHEATQQVRSVRSVAGRDLGCAIVQVLWRFKLLAACGTPPDASLGGPGDCSAHANPSPCRA